MRRTVRFFLVLLLSTSLGVSLAAAPATAAESGTGYWLASDDGAVYPFGSASSTFGPASVIRGLHAPIVGMAVTPNRDGYWLVAADGGVFSFGHAPFFGSLGGQHLNAPVGAITPTPDGGGYWLVARDGGVFAFGNAPFAGAATNQRPGHAFVGAARA